MAKRTLPDFPIVSLSENDSEALLHYLESLRLEATASESKLTNAHKAEGDQTESLDATHEQSALAGADSNQPEPTSQPKVYYFRLKFNEFDSLFKADFNETPPHIWHHNLRLLPANRVIKNNVTKFFSKYYDDKIILEKNFHDLYFDKEREQKIEASYSGHHRERIDDPLLLAYNQLAEKTVENTIIPTVEHTQINATQWVRFFGQSIENLHKEEAKNSEQPTIGTHRKTPS